MRIIRNLVLLACVLCMNGRASAQCGTVGYSNYVSQTGAGTSLTGGQYLMVRSQFVVGCCGYVSSWSFTAHNTGTLALQIWRSQGGTTYKLIGENVVTVASAIDYIFNIDSSEYIYVESGDNVGWYTSGAAIIDWDNGNNGAGNNDYLTSGTTATAVGASVTFSGTTNEDYALYATIVSLAGPTFSNLPSSVTFSKNSLSVGTTVFTALATVPASNVTVTYSIQADSPSGAFALDPSTGVVSPVSTSTSPNTYTLTIRATDTCNNNDDQDLTITVTNTAPVVHGLPLVVEVSESAVDETLIHPINVTDADGDSVTCTVSSTPSGPFTEKYYNGATPGEVLSAIYLQANPNLDYDTTSSYTITVSCTDTIDTDTGTIYVYVVKNNVPVISNLQNTTSITSVTPSNTAIFQVLYADVEGDEVSFSLACSPASPCPFVIYSSGQIFLSQSILGTSISAYEMDVTVSDAFTSSGTHRFTVYVTDLNTVPELANLPATIQVTEDTAIGSTVYTLSVYDEDGGTSHTFFTSFSPAAGAGLFSLENDSNHLTLSAKLDYFTQATSYNMTVEVSDGQAVSATSWLVLEIVNVNESPVLYQSDYQVQTEEAAAGTTFQNVRFNVFDPDGDNLTYAFTPDSDTYGFSIASSTGEISLTLDYDREDTGLGSSNRVWLISISDPSGLSVTATLTVSILDKEDNVPQLSSTSYTGSVSSDATVGQVVTTASASDADATAVNRVLEYSVSDTTVFNVDGSGNIMVFTDLASHENTQHTFTLTVRNPGSASSDTATVSIYVTKASSKGFFDKAENIALVTISSIVGLALLGGLAYLAINAYYKSNFAPPPYKATQVAPRDTKLPESNKNVRPLRSPEVFSGDWSAWHNDWY